MRLLVGPPGSGKTTAILREARRFIATGDAGFRLVAPSSTMAEHLRNALARDGLVVRPATILTLSALVASLTPETEEIGGEELALIVAECLAKSPAAAFAGLLSTPGLARTIASGIEDLANSGCGPLQWAALGGMGVWRGGVYAEFGRVWEEVERVLLERRLHLRAGRIARAAVHVRGGGLPAPLRAVFVDGFFSFSRLELELLQALDRKVDLSVTLPDWPGAASVRQTLENQRCQVVQYQVARAQPHRSVVAAVDPQREAEEITLRVLEAKGEGFAWRDMGIVMRSSGKYAPLIERALTRAGIPWRSYFGQSLSGTTVYRFLHSWIKALLSGWEHRQTLEAIRSAAHAAGTTPAAAALERIVIDELPGEGLSEFTALAGRVSLPGTALIQDAVQSWMPFSAWSPESVSPAAWVRRLSALSEQINAPSPSAEVTREQLDAARLRAAALLAARQALDSTARLLAEDPIPLETFWRAASSVMASATLRQRDSRRDVVHVMDVHEARQWELPVVFVCGLVEGEFPRRAAADPLLGDELRLQLRGQGFPLLTSADREREEAFLCEFAQTRATSKLTLTYPMFTSDGKPALRAFALDVFEGSPEPARPMRIAPSSSANAAARYNLQATEVLESIRRANATFKPTSLEDYLQCPFRFFARRTLRLREAPAGPEARVNQGTLGTVIHRAIERWHGGGGNLLAILETEWRRELARLRVPATWRTETQWLLLERSAHFYMAKGMPEAGWDIATEVPLSLVIEGFRFDGRADRVDRDGANHARVLEFKFVGATGLKKRKGKVEEGLAVQAPLYALALRQQGLEVVAYSIVGLRGDTAMVTYDEPEEVRSGMDFAAERAASAAFQITQGDIRVMPADEQMCGSCSFQDACRKREDAVAPAMAGGDEALE